MCIYQCKRSKGLTKMRNKKGIITIHNNLCKNITEKGELWNIEIVASAFRPPSRRKFYEFPQYLPDALYASSIASIF